MFKLYQVVNGKASLCGYDANNKRSLVAKAISLPTGLSHKTIGDKIEHKAAWVDGRLY